MALAQILLIVTLVLWSNLLAVVVIGTLFEIIIQAFVCLISVIEIQAAILPNQYFDIYHQVT